MLSPMIIISFGLDDLDHAHSDAAFMGAGCSHCQSIESSKANFCREEAE